MPERYAIAFQKMRIQNLAIIFLLTFLSVACTQNAAIRDPILSQDLRNAMDRQIPQLDSVEKARYSTEMNSFGIEFTTFGNDCAIIIQPYHSYYDVEKMDGYFYYKNKLISVYNLNSKCSEGFINGKDLLKGGLVKLRPQLEDAGSDFRLYIIRNKKLEIKYH